MCSEGTQKGDTLSLALSHCIKLNKAGRQISGESFDL